MKYRLVEYKTEQGKLKLYSVEGIFTLAIIMGDITNQIRSELFTYNNLYKFFKNLIDRSRNNNLNVIINFNINEFQIYHVLAYKNNDSKFHFKISNKFIYTKIVEKYKLQDELNRIELNFKNINLQDLINFILDYNKE